MERWSLAPLDSNVKGYRIHMFIFNKYLYNTFEVEDTVVGSRNRRKFLSLYTLRSSGGESETSEYMECQMVVSALENNKTIKG